ncbi:putative sugar ABC transporter, extracellular solute-binding protein family 1 [Paracholeplasma brassicae]|uniref:Putative sugar ABC transporter, extracellular solute-binding protein family 1 n=1 Tax=Acholeplasma brassicae TaxID=61635 RepID=U4KST1_9MOLU|nr:extracellular solute-binding protein [Paracholeplasma brassicae]CCV65479.1 putative sugar ABC transporter, extracellular solute-binding protein family 1 [Paracholeplasma brassicae]
MKKLLMVVYLSCLVAFGVFNQKQFELKEVNEEIPSLLEDNTYSATLKQWKAEGYLDNHSFMAIISPSLFVLSSDSSGYLTSLTEGYQSFLTNEGLSNETVNQVYEFDQSQTSDQYVLFEVDVTETGLYTLALDYYSLTETIREIELSVEVDGKTPYFEASQITLNSFYEAPSEFKVDRYGNDIMPNATQVRKWSHAYLKDTLRLQEDPLVFLLEAGTNEIKINRTNGYFKLGNLYVSNQVTYQSYESYLEENAFQTGNKTGTYTVEAENPTLKNTLSVRYTTNKSPSVTPFGLIENKLNIIDGSTFKTSGQAIYYDIDIKEAGFYQLSMKVLQTKEYQRVFRTISINGKIPFEEARNLPIKSSSKWQNHTFKDDEGNPLWFYLEEGINTVGIEASATLFRPIYEDIKTVMAGINDLALDIKKLTGNRVDENRDWDITTYMPNLANDLRGYGDMIKNAYEQWVSINGSKKASEVSTGLKLSYQWLYELADKPNSVPKNISKLSGTTNSVLQRLGILMPLTIDSPLSIDRIYVHGSQFDLPRANSKWYVNFWVSVRRFFASFFTKQYNDEPVEGELEIWVNRSRQYVNLMQQMADDEFTTEFGTRVKISIMPNEDKLILAASSGAEPDVAMGVAGWRPYDFAIRNAIVDLRSFDDFSEVANQFMDGAFLQLIYQNGVYGLPDTQNYFVMFYRKDIIEKLDLIVPDTWDEMLSILPELQRYGMNFYVNLSTTNAFKAFQSTMPFINQFGGTIYNDTVTEATLDNEQTIEALRFMTELYTVYSLPLEVGSFYNDFRYGKLPIGIGDFGMYVQLLHAAPEIAGLWDIAPMPGVLQNGVVNRSYDGAATASMIFKNSDLKEEAWDFLKWWSKKETQVNYSESLITSMGAEYMWNTSNVEAFREISWDESHKDVFLEQWAWINDTAKTPASYMLEREISNVWNKVVYDGVNLRTAVEDAQVIINKEITRKMIEFNFIDRNGRILKPYVLPTIENIERWVD